MNACWNAGEVKSLSRVRLFVTRWTVACQAPPSVGFSRQEYWSGLLFPSPGGLPDPGIEPGSPAFQADALTSELPGKPWWFESPITNLLNAYSLVWLRLLCPTPFTFSVWQAPWKIWKFHNGSLVRFLSTQTKQLELYQKSLWFFLENQDWGENSSKGCCTVVTKSTTTTKT